MHAICCAPNGRFYAELGFRPFPRGAEVVLIGPFAAACDLNFSFAAAAAPVSNRITSLAIVLAVLGRGSRVSCIKIYGLQRSSYEFRHKGEFGR